MPTFHFFSLGCSSRLLWMLLILFSLMLFLISQRRLKQSLLDIKTNNKKNINDNYNDNWKEWLCPARVPNLTATAITFRMAQDVFLNKETHQVPPNATIVDAFFSHWPGQLILQHMNTTAIALRTFKCGSITLKAYIQNTLRSSLPDSEFQTSFKVNTFPPHHNGCIVTAFRDPISHFISGLGEVECRRWRRRHRLNATNELEYYETLPILSQERFLAVVNFILTGGWFPNPSYYDNCCNVMAHVFPQSGYLVHLSRLKKNITSFVNLNSIQADFQQALIHDCALPTNIPPVAITKTHGKVPGLNDFLKSLWTLENDDERVVRALEAVCLLNAVDYACLVDQLQQPPPKICSRVYDRYFSHHQND